MENNKIKTTMELIDTIDIELISTIDEINQYMEGNVTKESLQLTLEMLAITLSKI